MIWIRIHAEQDGDMWSAYCYELGLASCGITEDEAVANLKHAVLAYCRALSKRGILEKRLMEKGIRFEQITPNVQETPKEKLQLGKLSPVLVA